MKPAPKARSASESNAASSRPELHHGDLRKGAFLRRRANYQMQASADSPRQAGHALDTAHKKAGGHK